MVTVNKTYLRDIENYNHHVLYYWQDTAHVRYWVDMPEKFPCIAIEVFEDNRDTKDTVHIDEFVYLSDFPVDQQK